MAVPVKSVDEEAARRARNRRRRKEIRRLAERRIAELRTVSDGSFFRSPKWIVVAFILMAVASAVFVKKVDMRAKSQGPIPHLSALRSVNALATALGRYKFHVGQWPTTEEGLRALNADTGHEGWLGPYLECLHPDPWATLYHYELSPSNTPVLFSCGPDQTPFTADDLHPDPACFDPGTEWTNEWVSAEERLPEL